MKLDNEFTVGVPIGQAWGVLTDLELIAPCMPGAQLTGVTDGVYTGKVRVKVGPVTAEYAGTARFSEKDDETYRAVIDARGRDSRGNGNASAVISAQLRPEGESTLVTVTTDGPPGTSSTVTPVTPSRFFSSPVTACTQCSQVIPVTW